MPQSSKSILQLSSVVLENLWMLCNCSWNKTPGKQLNSYRASLSLISSLHNKNLTYIVQTFVGRSGVRAEGDFQTWALRALIACCAAGPTPTNTACFSCTATAQTEDRGKIMPCPKHCCWGSGGKARGWADKLLHVLLGPSDLPSGTHKMSQLQTQTLLNYHFSSSQAVQRHQYCLYVRVMGWLFTGFV